MTSRAYSKALARLRDSQLTPSSVATSRMVASARNFASASSDDLPVSKPRHARQGHVVKRSHFDPFDVFRHDKFFEDAFRDPFFHNRSPFGALSSLMSSPASLLSEMQNTLHHSFPESMMKKFQSSMSVDVAELSDKFVITAEVPGCEREDVKVVIDDNNVLTISAERSETHAFHPSENESAGHATAAQSPSDAPATGAEATTTDSTDAMSAEDATAPKPAENKDITFHRVERVYGLAKRSLQLPESADTERITAKCKAGVLTLTIPKATQSQRSRQVNVD